ncbi:hypothetical protein EX30DRAFT_207035 [Ascodesmis nigricans]|uniref:K Homology domain-containing protein n=1 Tax=Ascodesmis nigricans TaxID=341454 RepID=A0A4S2MJY9_9PEZI|nr:hypothetical protein EX30DRAFT_207035 [Ascodesmis nigricans]
MMFAATHTLPPKPVFDHFSSRPSASPITTLPSPARLHLEHSQAHHYVFSLHLAIARGPPREDIIYATPKAESNWMYPPGCPPEQQRPLTLPYYQNLVRSLESTASSLNLGEAVVRVVDPNTQPSMGPKNLDFEGHKPKRDIGISIWLAATDQNSIMQMRTILLGKCPVCLRTATIDIDSDMYFDSEKDGKAREKIQEHIRNIASSTGTDIFVLKPLEDKAQAAGDPEVDASQSNRLRLKIYGDYEAVEHAKTRLLTMIDDMLGHFVQGVYHEVSIHPILCGRNRKNVRAIEAITNTAIYFPPPFPRVYGFSNASGGQRRHPDEIFITGKNRDDIARAEVMLVEVQQLGQHSYVKMATLNPRKLDFILLERLDEVKKIMETNATFIQFPQVGAGTSAIRVSGIETLHIERTIRSIMALAGQYYEATFWFHNDNTIPGGFQIPPDVNLPSVLVDVSSNSLADLAFHKNYFEIAGPDWAVRRCMELLNSLDYIRRGGQFQLRVKIELANEHKEFVAGKKNGKINKIMGQTSIHILFDGFNEYNFYIDVVGSNYDNVQHGLDLVEQELPASMSFHVPDSYHKRIIGVGGQHIQQIMKKYSVFVKFSNAMERGSQGKVDNEDLKVDNVICRTPARNAGSLELVKQEIMDMVQQVDADIITESLEIPRLRQRELMTKRPVLDALERKWDCNLFFPSTETASDFVSIKGPQWQLVRFKDEVLGLLEEHHQIRLVWSPELGVAVRGSEFERDVVSEAKEKFGITIGVDNEPTPAEDPKELAINFFYARNVAGNLPETIDLINGYLAKLQVRFELVKGNLSRPKSDSFEEFAQYFENAVLQTPADQNPLNRPGSRLSVDVSSLYGDTRSLHSEPGQIDTVQEAFYNGDRRRSSIADSSMIGTGSVSHPPGSAGSASSHGSYHSRAASLGSDWDRISDVSRTG